MKKMMQVIAAAVIAAGFATMATVQAAAPAAVAPAAPGGAAQGAGAAPGAGGAGGAPAAPGGRAGRGGGRGGGRGAGVAEDALPVPDLVKQKDPPRDNPLIKPTSGGVRAPRHDAFVERAKQGGIDLLFEGDSITDWWQQNPPNGGSAMLKKYWENVKLADFAVAGDTTQGVLWGLKHGESEGFKPKAIMMMIGTNNAGGATAEEIAEGIGAIVQYNRKQFPDAQILLLAIFPRGDIMMPATIQMRAKLAACNKIISKLDGYEGHVKYMDIGDKFLDPQTKAFLPDAFRPDNLHPKEKGYDLWGTAVAPTLAEWLK